MIGQPKWNFMMSELPLLHKLKKWNKRKMKWGEEGLNGGFLMGKAKLRLIYVAWSPVSPHQPIWQEKWKSNCWDFFDAMPQTVIYWLKLITVYPLVTRNMLHQHYKVQHVILSLSVYPQKGEGRGGWGGGYGAFWILLKHILIPQVKWLGIDK